MKNRIKQIIEQLVSNEKKWSCGIESRLNYNKISLTRFKKTLEICKQHVPNQNACVLDVGRSNLTKIITSYYETVYSLGFDLEKDKGGHREIDSLSNIPHIVFDLNNSDQVEKYPDYPNKFDLILFCETIEHLYIAPEFTLLMLSYLLKPNGIIIVTTPNAVSIKKRIKMFRGMNPYEKIRLYSKNPGHYRESTKNELITFGENADLIVKVCYTTNFLNLRNNVKSMILLPVRIIPQFKDYLVGVFQKK